LQNSPRTETSPILLFPLLEKLNPGACCELARYEKALSI
jgi:hypothetical protein